MKKIILSGFTIASFLIYGLYQKTSGANATDHNPVPNPPSLNTHVPSATYSYKDGVYTGNPSDAYYGMVQVRVVIINNKISDITFMQYPNDRQHSIAINSYAMPILKQEAIKVQSAKVDIVSGATASSRAFIQSFNSALSNAL